MSDLAIILATLQSIEAKIDALSKARPNAAKKPAGEAAPAAELDGPRGNPEIRFSPRDWKGANMVGRKMSDCDPDFLEAFARFKDWSAAKDDESGAAGEVDAKGYAKSGKWARVDAGLARGWAARIRARKGGENAPF